MGGVTGENMLSRAYRAAEFPGANMFANAHSLANRHAKWGEEEPHPGRENAHGGAR